MEDMKLSRGPMIAITVLRVVIGWHFLYEGLIEADGAVVHSGGLPEAGARARLPSCSGRWPPSRTCSPTRTSSRCGASRSSGCF